jgi:mannose-6-phosphate isomerase-like protein (cupin superfamily)
MNCEKCRLSLAIFLMVCIFSPAAQAQDDKGFIVHKPDQLKWQPAPAALPKGAEVAVLRGDPTKPGIFTMRLKFPAGYVVSPHWHTQDEHVTVISGEMKIGMGDKPSRSETTSVAPGSLMVMPATHHHFAFFDKETVLQLHGIAPWVVNYVNPKDDPRLNK